MSQDTIEAIKKADANAMDKLDKDRFQLTITSADATTATQVVAGVDGKSIYLTSLLISTDTATNFQFQDDNASPAVLIEQIYMGSNSTVGMAWHMQFPIKVAEAEDLDVIAAGAGNVSVTVTGYIE